MDVADRIRRGVKWLALGKAATQVILWGCTIVTMRLLAPADYGLVALAAVFMSFVALFQELGLRVRLVQLEKLEHDYVRAVYGLSILVNLTLALCLVAAAPLIAAFFGEERLALIVTLLAVQFLFSSIAVIPDAMIRRSLDFRALTLVEMLQSTSGALLTLALAWMGYGVWSLVCGTLLAALVKSLGLIWISPFRALPRLTFKGMRSTLVFGGYVTGQRISWWFYTGFSTMILGRLFDAATVGIYTVAHTIAFMPLEKLGSIMATASFAGLSRVAGDMPVFQAYLLKGVRLLSVAGFPVFFGIAAIVAELTPLVLGEKWLPIVPVAQLLCLVMPLRMLNGPLTESLNAIGKPAAAWNNVLIVAVFVIAGVAAGVAWGPVGVAWGWVASFPVAFLISTARVARHCGLAYREFLRPMLPAAGLAGAMLTGLHFGRPYLPLPFPSWEGLAATVLLGILFYGPATLLLDREGSRQVRALLKR
ncbi:MAG: lipopolysaccharide biosynthesis protein [Alphaproteobacteria bacterium]|nr:lipopolysaccharide biosynthesis protein [Alphaproteobacteria bacterium]